MVFLSAEAASKGPFERFEKKQWCACLRMLRNEVSLRASLVELWDDALCPEMGVAQKHAIIPVPTNERYFRHA